jgi:xylan 1,4-beta-xylosidase
MRGDRVQADSTGALTLDEVRDRGVRNAPDISAMATADSGSASILVWNYHDDDLPAPAAQISLTIEGPPNGRATLTHYRVDTDHSNAYTAWKSMGSPQPPTASQRDALLKAAQLQTLGPPERVTIADRRAVVTFTLPRQGVSLLRITW